MAAQVFLITQKNPISPRLWAITEEFEYRLVTCDCLLNRDRSARRLFAGANRKQNFRGAERAPVLLLVLSIVCNFVIDDWHMITDQSSIIIGTISALI